MQPLSLCVLTEWKSESYFFFKKIGIFIQNWWKELKFNWERGENCSFQRTKKTLIITQQKKKRNSKISN